MVCILEWVCIITFITIIAEYNTAPRSQIRNMDGGQALATVEGKAADVGHAVGNVDGGQALAMPEGLAADSGHAVGDGDGGQTAAIKEGIDTDAGHAVGDVIVGDGGRNVYCTHVLIGVAGHFGHSSLGDEVVVDAVYFYSIGQCGCCACKEAEAQEDVPKVNLSHCF